MPRQPVLPPPPRSTIPTKLHRCPTRCFQFPFWRHESFPSICICAINLITTNRLIIIQLMITVSVFLASLLFLYCFFFLWVAFRQIEFAAHFLMAVKLGWAYKDEIQRNPTQQHKTTNKREQLNKEVTPETGSDINVVGMRKGIWADGKAGETLGGGGVFWENSEVLGLCLGFRRNHSQKSKWVQWVEWFVRSALYLAFLARL